MREIAPGLDNYSWPDCSYRAIDESLCFHSRKFIDSVQQFDVSLFDDLSRIVGIIERVYVDTKVLWKGWPDDWDLFIRKSVDFNSSPGWPWKRQFPTNRDLFGFDGVKCAPERIEMIKAAVKQRWFDLTGGLKADPIHVFVKQEPHKRSKVEKKSWRLISGVGITDSIIDRLLYGDWLDKMISDWPLIPSKAGWAPQKGGFGWLCRTLRGKVPVSIDKSSWDWTVNAWHISLIRNLIPRMIFVGDEDREEWLTVFRNRMDSLYSKGVPVFKYACGCEFEQVVTGIQKSGCLGTIAFNSIWQFAAHLAAGGSEHDVFHCLGDDTLQEKPSDMEDYVAGLLRTGAVVKEVEEGWPIKFGGHEMTELESIPAYKDKHMFSLLYLDNAVGPETLESYRHLYALDPVVSRFLERLHLRLYGPRGVLSREYLRDWYLSLDD